MTIKNGAISQRNGRPMLTITIDENILNEFRYFTTKNAINRSKLIETMIVNWLKIQDDDIAEKAVSKLNKLDFIKD